MEPKKDKIEIPTVRRSATMVTKVIGWTDEDMKNCFLAGFEASPRNRKTYFENWIEKYKENKDKL